jgi:hypothetical protein
MEAAGLTVARKRHLHRRSDEHAHGDTAAGAAPDTFASRSACLLRSRQR